MKKRALSNGTSTVVYIRYRGATLHHRISEDSVLCFGKCICGRDQVTDGKTPALFVPVEAANLDGWTTRVIHIDTLDQSKAKAGARTVKTKTKPSSKRKI
jgi:hypothetical protein